MPKLVPKSKIARCLFFLGLVAIFFGVATGGLFWQMNQAIYSEGFKFGRSAEWPYLYPAPSDKQAEYDKELAEVLDRYPDLKPQWRSVADKENGFLELFNLFEYIIGADGVEMEHGVALSNELRQELSGVLTEEEFGDGKRFSGVIKELDRIAELKERSCAGVDPYRLFFHPPEAVKNFTKVLLYDARLAANEGDKERALSRVRTAVRIGEHFSQVETVSLNAVVVSTLLEKVVLETTFNDLFPRLELTEGDYRKWREVISSGHVNFGSKNISIGDFNIIFPVLSAPICESVWLFKLSGVDNTYDAMAECHLELMKLSAGGYRDCLDTKSLEVGLWDKVEKTPYFSRRLVRVLYVGIPAHIKTVTRASARFRYYDAALAQLGGEELPLELITETPFIFDSEKKVLTMPDDPILEQFEFEPIELSFGTN